MPQRRQVAAHFAPATNYDVVPLSDSKALTADGSYDVCVRLRDAKDNAIFGKTSSPLVFDTEPPLVDVGAAVTASAAITKIATVTGASHQQWSKDAGTGAITFGSDTGVSTTIAAASDETYTIRLTAQDAAGNAAYSQFLLNWNTPASPYITTATATPATAAYGVNSAIDIVLTFSESVTVSGGTPTLKLETGSIDRLASYVSGSPGTALTFRYTVQNGDATLDLDVHADSNPIDLAGATIVGTIGGKSAVLTVPQGSNSSSLASQHAIVVDTSAPANASALVTAADAPNGADTRVDDDTGIYFAWTAGVDAESGIAGYTLKRYTQAGCAGTSTDTTGITGTSQSFTGTSGTTYSFELVTINQAGMTSTSSCSGSLTIDTAAPTGASALVTAADAASGADVRFDDDTTIYFAWTAGSSAASGVAGYTLQRYDQSACAGTSTDTSGITGTSQSFTGSSDTTYSFKVVTYSNAGLSVTSACSGDIRIDTSAPTAATSLVTAADSAGGADVRYDDDTTLYLAWPAGADTGSGIASYTVKRYAQSSCAGGSTDTTGITGTSTSFTGTTNTTYSFTVTTINNAGLSSTSLCSGDIFIDTTLPTAASSLITAADAAGGADARYDDDTTIYFAWTAGSSAASGVAGYTLQRYGQAACAGTSTDTTGITGTSQSFTGSSDTTYSFKVVTYSNAGLSVTSACSGDIRIDTSAPTAATSLVTAADSAGGADVRYDDDTTLYLAWPAGADTGSGIASYTVKRYAQSSCAGGSTDTTGLTGTSTSFTGTTNTTYSFTVTTVNNAGLSSTSMCSGDILIDTTAPTTASSLITAADAAGGADARYDDDMTVYLVWTPGSDTESGVVSETLKLYSQSACAGTSTDTTGLSSSSQSFTASADGVYSFKIVTINNSGLSTTTSCSGDIIIDTTPPSLPATFSVAPVNTANNLAWSASSGNPAGYVLVKRVSAAVTWAPTNGLSYTASAPDADNEIIYVGSNLSYPDTGLVNGTTYHYGLYAYDSLKNYAAAKIANKAPSPVPTISGVSHAYAKVSVQWQYTVTSGATGTAPLVYSLVSSPATASINSSTGMITYTPAAAADESVTVRITDGDSRTADHTFTLHTQAYALCIWTGATSTAWSTAGNWTYCGGVAPTTGDRVAIDGTKANQPIVAANTTIDAIGPAIYKGGTITVNAGFTLTLSSGTETVQSDVKFAGATAACTTCNVAVPVSTHFTINNDATLTLGSGLQVVIPTVAKYIYVGDGSSAGTLATVTASGTQSQWPRLYANDGSRVVVTGTSSTNSHLAVNGLQFTRFVDNTNTYTNQSILSLSDYYTVDQFDNVVFTNPTAGRASQAMIILQNCNHATISDTAWSSITFGKFNGRGTYSIDANTCSGVGPIAVTGTGLGYGVGGERDPNGIITWSDSAQTCEWTGATSTAWETASNWTSCDSAIPTLSDWVVIPSTAPLQPTVNADAVVKGVASGTGGGTIKIVAGATLFMVDPTHTIQSDVTVAGATSPCETCVLSFGNSVIVIDNGATLTLGNGLYLSIDWWMTFNVGTTTSAGTLATVVASADMTSYPKVPSYGIIEVQGPSTATRSKLNLDGLVVEANNYGSSSYAIDFTKNFEVVKFDNVFISSKSATFPGIGVYFRDCTGGIISDLTWSNLYFGAAGYTGTNIKATHATCTKANMTGGADVTVSGRGSGHGATYESDTNSIFSWAAAEPCGGTVIAGLCWYLGNNSESCDTVCTGHGGYHMAGGLLAGDEGSDTGCTNVIAGLGGSGAATRNYSTTTYRALGCFLDTSTGIPWRSVYQPISSSSAPLAKRACSCVE